MKGLRSLFRPGSLGASFFPAKFRQLLGPALLAGAAALLIAVAVVSSGMLNLAASTPHPQGWAQVLHFVFKRSIAHHAADIAVPKDIGSPAMIAKGAGYYGMACAHCHAGPGLGQNPIALSMRPSPQYLLAVLDQFSPSELFYIVKHGVKYSAMPAYPIEDRDDEIWSIVAFLRAMPRLSTDQFRTLAYGATTSDGPPIGPLQGQYARYAYRMHDATEAPASDHRFTGPALGFDDIAMRGDVTQTCERCHTGGGVGQPNGMIPNLTLLDPVYMRQALSRFASGRRHSGFMLPVATQLSPQQMTALTRYYTSTRRPSPTSASPDPALVALGERIAQKGVDAAGNAECASCHDINRASAKAYPTLDGQHQLYIRARMHQYRAERSQAKPGANPMLAIAARLNDRQIDAVSAYYAARSINAAPIAQAPR